MTDDDDPPPPTDRRPHILRLVALAVFLLVLFYLVAVARVIDVGGIRALVDSTGPAAPLAYVVVSACLGACSCPVRSWPRAAECCSVRCWAPS
ncbi:transmembrane protein [Mycolicibacterium conceptionense]|uniref:Transmembrane protein n=1 Tax=Mycolicibacterium conceptionense TaxID=451644 RepID=A0A0U1DZ15_9MYCO|nr:transmembrane protein [Mycolicibacterium conceptionense]